MWFLSVLKDIVKKCFEKWGGKWGLDLGFREFRGLVVRRMEYYGIE